MGMKDTMKGERALIRHLMQPLHICSDNRAEISRQSSRQQGEGSGERVRERQSLTLNWSKDNGGSNDNNFTFKQRTRAQMVTLPVDSRTHIQAYEHLQSRICAAGSQAAACGILCSRLTGQPVAAAHFCCPAASSEPLCCNNSNDKLPSFVS